MIPEPKSLSAASAAACRGCGGPAPRTFFQVPRAPASVGSLPSSETAARNVPCGAIRLSACPECGLIQNQLFDVALVGFEPGYEVSLIHTPTFRKYIEGVCDRLIERYKLQSKNLLEIGCGGGDFLRLICRSGSNHGVGIDPTVPRLTEEQVGSGTVRLVPGFFSPKHADIPLDLICCLSVFEAIPEPLEFLRTLRRAIGERTVPVYFEVFNGFRAIAEREVWSIHYEQCNYFSLCSLQQLFRRAGFEITNAGTCYQGDQYLFIEAAPGPVGKSFSEPHCESDVLSHVLEFEREYCQRREWWLQQIEQWRTDSLEVVVWGSGGKGISFLSSFPDAPIKYVVDVNPDRQGGFIPLSGQEIIAPQRLQQLQPQVVILTNKLYRSEIEQQLRELQLLDCEVLVA